MFFRLRCDGWYEAPYALPRTCVAVGAGARRARSEVVGRGAGEMRERSEGRAVGRNDVRTAGRRRESDVRGVKSGLAGVGAARSACAAVRRRRGIASGVCVVARVVVSRPKMSSSESDFAARLEVGGWMG